MLPTTNNERCDDRWRHRCRCVSFLSLFLASSTVPAWRGRPVEAQTAEVYHRRADAALASFLVKFWSGPLNYLRHRYQVDTPTGYWTFAQGFDALLDGVERTRGEQYAGAIETFYSAQDVRGWFAGFYDDENWMALALMRAYDLTGEPKYLSTAEMLYWDIQSGWDTSCCGPRPGGIWWNKGHSQKATASNAGPVIAGVRLAERTADDSYLEFARQVYDYWFENMVDPQTFQVTDHIEPSGTKVYWRFTYNEGLMIGAGIELYKATGEERYLENARNIAGFLLTEEVREFPFGCVLSDGGDAQCTGDCHAFKGPAYRYLMLLLEESDVSPCDTILQISAEAIWQLARDPSRDLFGVEWSGPPPDPDGVSEPQTAAAVMALNLFATHFGPYPGSGTPADRYEAENATFFGIGPDDTHSGFDGWGYLTGPAGSLQHVTFLVEVPRTGPHLIRFRYASRTDDAVRAVEFGGGAERVTVEFPATGSWTTWAETDFVHTLAAGVHTVTVRYSFPAGSTGSLHLDWMSVVPYIDPFIRGDANADGELDVSDIVFMLLHLFAGGTPPACQETGDGDDSGEVNVTDATYLAQVLFLGEEGPPPPFPECGSDVTDDLLSCEVHPLCER